VNDDIVAVSGMVMHHNIPRHTNPTGLEPYILNVYVTPELRGRGISKHLLKMLIKEARKARAIKLTLRFWPGKEALYSKLGFKTTKNEMRLDLKR